MKLRRMYKYVFALVSFVFTGFVFLNTYEVVWNKDVIIARSVQKVVAQQVIDTAVKDFAIKAGSTDDVGDLGGITALEIPSLKIRLRAEEARSIDGQWYQRPSMAHYIGLNKNKDGVPVDYLLYAGTSWRTLPAPDRIAEGTEVHLIDNHGGTSVFTVSEKKQLSLDRSLIVSKTESRQIVLIVEDPHSGMYYGYSLVLKK